MKIKTLRIHAIEPDHAYRLFDRHGRFEQARVRSFEILNPPKIKRFGFCPIDTIDVTLEFETPLDSKQIKCNM
jgi:hypothetical protein